MTAGVSVFHRGRIVTYGTEDGLPGGAVTAIARDSGGTMWAATSRGLARLVGGRWEAIDTAAGYPGGYTEPVLVDGSGSVWAVAGDGDLRPTERGGALREARAGRGRHPGAMEELLVAARTARSGPSTGSYGVYPVADGRGGPPPPRTLAYPDTGIYALTWSRDHPAVAIGTSGRLVRLWLPTSTGKVAGARGDRPPRALTIPFSRSAGMSGNLVVAALYDREGSLWVGTPTGIDRFRETKLTPIAPPGYLEAPGVAPDTNGTAWVAARRGGPAALLRVGDAVSIPRLDAPSMLTCIYRDLRGGLWIGGRGLWDGRVTRSLPCPCRRPREKISKRARDPGGGA